MEADKVNGAMFSEGPWGTEGREAVQAHVIVATIDRAYGAFSKSVEAYRAMAYAIEESLRRQPDLADRVQELREPMRRTFLKEHPGELLPRPFRGDAWHLADDDALGLVEVKAGPFTMGGDASQARLAEHGFFDNAANAQSVIDLPAYYIARYRFDPDSTGFHIGFRIAVVNRP